jgi:restriction endonuclease S subunit
VRATTEDRLVPLHCASGRGHASVVRLLLDGGADVRATTGDGMMPLYSSAFLKTPALLPPLEEQQRIVDGIAHSTLELDAAIDRYEREIALLREYRTRLTADVVTGKLDVRAAAAQMPDPEDALAEAENFEEEPELEEVEG